MAQITVEQALQIALGHHQAGQLQQAEVLYRQILAQQPNHADALNLLGVLASQAGHHDVAVNMIRRAVEINPTFPDAYNNLGNALKANRQLEEAATAYQQAIALKSNFPEAYNNLGNVLKDNRQLRDAIAAYSQAIALKPDYHQACNNLGVALRDSGKIDDAIVAYRQAIVLNPSYAEAHNNLGVALIDKGQIDDAIVSCRKAIALKPALPEAHANLAGALKDMGRLDEAIAAIRQAVDLRPGFLEAYSNLVYTLNFHPAYDAKRIAEELGRWNHQYAEPLKKSIQPHTNDPNPDRRLRIGYVSPDFGMHPVGHFLLPLLAHHDRNHFEIFAYAQVLAPDGMTQQIRSQVDHWRDIQRLSDAQVADLIRDDKIDILVDLTMHMARHRLLVFARKPSPVQLTWLAYAGSTGLETIDYRLSDPYLDPPGMDESIYSEQTIRLPESYWCYQPNSVPAEISLSPGRETGIITFGCLNNFCKINEPTLLMWAKILRAVPHSCLLLHAHEGSHRQQVQDLLKRKGIEPGRIRFVGKLPLTDYLRLYDGIDIALDTFPYGGGTTTCDALWMGAPVVSLVGDTAVGRGGLSILSNIGLPELAAHSAEEFVRIATELANDVPRLSSLRSTLRQRMEQSLLMDAPRFAGNIEAAYRQMWRRWCAV